MRSFSVDVVGCSDDVATDGLRDAPDTQFVEEGAEHLAADHTDIVLSNDDLFDPVARAAVLRARDLPVIGDLDLAVHAVRGCSRAVGRDRRRHPPVAGRREGDPSASSNAERAVQVNSWLTEYGVSLAR